MAQTPDRPALGASLDRFHALAREIAGVELGGVRVLVREVTGAPDAFDFTWGDQACRAVWLGPSKAKQPGLRLGVLLGEAKGETPGAPGGSPYRGGGARPALETPAPLVLRPETGWDRFGKAIRLSREAQTGDADFDARVYIECEGPDAWARALLVDPLVRAAVLRCLSAGEEATVNLDDRGLLFLELRSADLDLFSRASLERLLGLVLPVADAAPPLAPRRFRLTAALRTALLRFAAVGWALGLLFAPLFASWWRPFSGELAAVGLGGGLALWLLLLPVAVLLCRGRPTALRDVLICFFLLPVSLPSCVLAALYLANGALDGSPIAAHATEVVSLRAERGKNPSYYAKVSAWPGGEGAAELPVDRELHAKLRKGDRLIVRSRRGALGWPWLVSVKREGGD